MIHVKDPRETASDIELAQDKGKKLIDKSTKRNSSSVWDQVEKKNENHKEKFKYYNPVDDIENSKSNRLIRMIITSFIIIVLCFGVAYLAGII